MSRLPEGACPICYRLLRYMHEENPLAFDDDVEAAMDSNPTPAAVRLRAFYFLERVHIIFILGAKTRMGSAFAAKIPSALYARSVLGMEKMHQDFSGIEKLCAGQANLSSLVGAPRLVRMLKDLQDLSSHIARMAAEQATALRTESVPTPKFTNSLYFVLTGVGKTGAEISDEARTALRISQDSTIYGRTVG